MLMPQRYSFIDLVIGALAHNGQGERISRGAMSTPIHAWHGVIEAGYTRELLCGQP